MTNQSSRTGVGLFGLTFLALLILKLTNLTTISWWWVWLPLLGIPVLIVVVFLALLGFALLIDTSSWARARYRHWRNTPEQR